MSMSADRPTVRQLEYVVAVADHRNFSRAAEACGVSQPALSSQVKEVEDRLGLTLFERGRAGVSIPAHAVPVIELARRAITAVDDVMTAALGQQDELVGEVRVGVIPTMAPYLLPVLVEELRRRHPRASPILVEERTEPLVARLRAGTLDVGLLASPVPADDLRSQPLAVDAFRLALPADHPLAGTGPLPSGVLSGLPLLLLEDGHCLRDQALDVCAAVGATSSGSIQATSLTTLCQMVAAGVGVTLLPESAVGLEAREGSGLTVRALRDPSPSREVVLAWRPTDPHGELYGRLATALAAPMQARCSRSTN